MKNIKKFENFSIVEAGRWYQGKIVSEPCPLIPRNNQGQWNLIDWNIYHSRQHLVGSGSEKIRLLHYII